MTLHQGIPGVVNGTLVNPYINYPFVPPTVRFMANYTAQARALGMRTKFYYTMRELSNRAAELFALNCTQLARLIPFLLSLRLLLRLLLLLFLFLLLLLLV